MSETWVDAMETDAFEDVGEGAYDSDDTGEGAYDSDDTGEDFGEESRSARRRRQRQRQIMLARQRQQQAQMRRSGRPPSPAQRPVRAAGPSPRQTIRAIQSLDLETKVELDSLRRRLEESNRRASRGTWATVAGVAAAEVINQFDALENHPNVSAAILGAPLLLLSPEKQRSGIEGFLLDPRVIGGAAVVGIAVASRWGNATHGPGRIRFVGDKKVTAGNSGKVTGLVFDHNDNYLSDAAVTYTAVPSGILNIASDGTFTTTAGTTGKVEVIARSGEASKSTTVTVKS
jgi:hypothetical protein